MNDTLNILEKVDRKSCYIYESGDNIEGSCDGDTFQKIMNMVMVTNLI